MVFRRALLGNRRFRIGRVVGPSAIVQAVIWSVIAVGALTVYRSPALLDGPLSAGAILAAVPLALAPLVVAAVVVLVVALNFLREVRDLLFGRRSRSSQYHSHEQYTDDEGGLVDDFGGFGGFGGGGDGGGDGDGE
jgi:hypothetical protein